MKLRIQGNSLRMRISEAEVTQFSQTGEVEEAIAFGPAEDQKLRYILLKTTAFQQLQVSFTPNKVTIYIPEKTAIAWTETNLNSLEGLVNNGTEKGLKILIEKDLDCYHQ